MLIRTRVELYLSLKRSWRSYVWGIGIKFLLNDTLGKLTG